MNDYLVYGDVNTSCYGVFISGAEAYNAPEYDLTFVSVPGRSGDLVINNGRFKNMAVRYPAFVRDGFTVKRGGFIAAMMREPGYKKILSTYDPEHFRMGTFYRATEFQTGPWNRSAKFDLVFDCKPQRFLASGQTERTLTESGVIINPTCFNALPIIRITGAGTVTVNGYAVQTLLSGETVVDSEMQDCYSGTESRNNNVIVSEFPRLGPGENVIDIGSGVTSVAIIPRWWEI